MNDDVPDEYSLRLAAVKQALMELFGNKEADEWLHCEQECFQGRRPIDLLESEIGYLEVSAVIHRILDGTFI
jgi:uncharacterized protein (DUF2384 family)